jgi:hypothetical protein
MLSPDSRANLARCQAEAPLIALCRFSKPALISMILPKPGKGAAASGNDLDDWMVKRRSKSSRTASDPDSPLGCAMAASLDPA